MNLLAATLIVVVAMCNAEPPRFRRFQRQSVQPNAEAAAPAPAPYPPAGYRPAGAQFNLPQKEYGTPARGYGPPDSTPPLGTTTEAPETTTTTEEAVTMVEPQAENVKLEKDTKRPVFLVLPRAEQHLRSESYVSHVQEYPVVEVQPAEVAFQKNAAIYSSQLQTLPLNVYNPYAFYQVYH